MAWNQRMGRLNRELKQMASLTIFTSIKKVGGHSCCRRDCTLSASNQGNLTESIKTTNGLLFGYNNPTSRLLFPTVAQDKVTQSVHFTNIHPITK